jgi:hypothetical protein
MQFVLHRKHAESSLKNTKWLMLFGEIIAVYFEHHMEEILKYTP